MSNKANGRKLEDITQIKDKEIEASIDLKIKNGILQSEFFKNTIVTTRKMTKLECQRYGVDYKKIVLKETSKRNKK